MTLIGSFVMMYQKCINTCAIDDFLRSDYRGGIAVFNRRMSRINQRETSTGVSQLYGGTRKCTERNAVMVKPLRTKVMSNNSSKASFKSLE